jgi:exodeoxyribonuclease VII large subunit
MFPRLVPAAAPPRPYTVSELLTEVGLHLKASWRNIAVAGEIGRWDLRGGHGYFTLKDRTGCLNAIIFASELELVPFRVEPGLEVVVRGSLDIYTPQGKFQLKAFAIEPVGAGALQLAFEQLKAKLAAEGLFDKARKRPIPALSRRIAVVTSPAGAAIRDILNVLRRRFDGLAITIYPVRVQGEGAAAEIAEAIRTLNRREEFDVLIVARGGGSPEDLAPFNDERVARALAASDIPTISAVGHETDVTIADLVADLRAPTPSAAAELVVDKKEDLVRRVRDLRARFGLLVRESLSNARSRLTSLSRADGLLQFRYRLRDFRERIAQSRAASLLALERRPAREAARLEDARRVLWDFARVVELPRTRESVERRQALLQERMRRGLERRGERLRGASGKLDMLSPLAVLARGYAVVYREGSKRALRSVESVRIGDRIRMRLHEGELGAIVRETGKPRDDGPLFSEPLAEPAASPAQPSIFDSRGNGEES